MLKARVISSPKKPTGKPLSCAVFETIDRIRRGLRFTPMRVSTLRSEAGMVVLLSQCANLVCGQVEHRSHSDAFALSAYLVVYPPLIRMVCPVIHQPSLTR